MKVRKNENWLLSCVQHFAVPWTVQPTRLLCPWDSPGKNTGVGIHYLLQGIFLTQGLNLGLPHCRKILYHLNHKTTDRQMKLGIFSFSLKGSISQLLWSIASSITLVCPWVGKIPWRRKRLPIPVLWPGEFHGLQQSMW